MLALIKNNPVLNRLEVLGQFPEGGWVDLPDGSRVSPAYDGWELRGYELKTIVAADPVPSGQHVASSSLVIVNGVPKIVNVLAADVTTSDMVDVERDRRIGLGFSFNGKLYQARDADIRNINGASVAATIAIMNGALQGDLRWSDATKDFQWIAADNTMVSMDAQTVIAFGQTAMAWVTAVTLAGRAIKNRLIVGETLNISENSLWPAQTV